jgi:hypothetical protein
MTVEMGAGLAVRVMVGASRAAISLCVTFERLLGIDRDAAPRAGAALGLIIHGNRPLDLIKVTPTLLGGLVNCLNMSHGDGFNI